MKLFLQMLSLQLAMFILIIVGIIAKKRKIINREAQKSLSNLLIYFILPCNIIVSFKGNLTGDLISKSFIALLISIGIQVLSVILGKVLFMTFPDNMKPIMSYGLICSNSSFIGLPVIGNIYNSIGVLYASIFQIPIRITMWTSGLTEFTGRKFDENGRKKSAFTRETIGKLLVHPCIVAVFLGLIIMFLHIQLPSPLDRSITLMSECTIPVSMIVIGCILAQCKASRIFDKATIYFTFIRLLAFPIFILLILKALKVDSLLTGVAVMLTGMPAGTTTAILADKYGCDAAFGSRVIFVSTLASIITIPILCALL